MPSHPLVELRAGSLRLELSPSIGGSIRAFEWIGGDDSQPILRRCHSESQSVLEAASFPLVPYVNRIRGGAFEFRERRVRIDPNMPGDPSPLHGQGWLGAWTVERQDGRTALLSFDHPAGEWPWEYRAVHEFTLDPAGLGARLACRNLSSEPMPCGLGHHPYFPCGAETVLDTDVAIAWTIDADVLPVDKVAADGRYDLRQRRICGQHLDNGFGGWGGEATMSDPGWPYQVRMSSPDAHFFQVYSPSEGGFFVAEPVTHANAALNAPETEWAELGLRVLDPGEEMSLTMRLDIMPR